MWISTESCVLLVGWFWGGAAAIEGKMRFCAEKTTDAPVLTPSWENPVRWVCNGVEFGSPQDATERELWSAACLWLCPIFRSCGLPGPLGAPLLEPGPWGAPPYRCGTSRSACREHWEGGGSGLLGDRREPYPSGIVLTAARDASSSLARPTLSPGDAPFSRGCVAAPG